MSDNYEAFLEKKLVRVIPSGFEVMEIEINPVLFLWQRAVVMQALRGGRYALFEECGLGKTLQQVEWSKHVQRHTAGFVLICCPLAVAYQTIAEAAKIGVKVTYIRSQEQAIHPGIYITNYDMLNHFDGPKWDGVVLDESSILKNYTGQMKRLILEMFRDVRFKLCCTATPAPNDPLELGNHAEFLGLMKSNEMIADYFVNDSMASGNYRLKGHAEKRFWGWVASWATCISKPSDIGFPDFCDEYSFEMPDMVVKTEIVGVDHTRAWESGKMFVDGTVSATSMWREKRHTLTGRCERARDIIGESQDTWVIWCETDDESDYLQKIIPQSVDVRGSDSVKEKERKLSAFTNGEIRILITKASIAGFGMNWQHCNHTILVSATYSFEKTYQALRRFWRFGQKLTVYVWMIVAESEGEIQKALEVKQKQHKEMQTAMSEAMKVNGLDSSNGKGFFQPVVESEESGQNWRMLLGDCVKRIKEIEDESIDFSIYSPPFKGLYIYSTHMEDMGNCSSDEEFLEHYKFLIQDLYRVTKPGRLSAVHCKDLPLYHNRDGAAGLQDFPGEIVRAHCVDEKLSALNVSKMVMQSYGVDTSAIDIAIQRRLQETGPMWIFHSRVTIWKDPVIEMQRTKNHGLLHKNFVARSEVVRQGMADYLLVFRKWDGVEGTESAEPVKHHLKAPGISKFQRVMESEVVDSENLDNEKEPHVYRGENPPEHYRSDRDYSIAVWQRYASPVWFDISQTNVLNKQQAREDADEKHICPLQLDVIERGIDLWTNPGDLVCDPFNGIGSTGYSALKMKRRYIGMELKEAYFNVSTGNLKDAEAKYNMPDLFSLAGITV
jgi:DNA modification methylase/superfamily II DNA or RNA helicase